MNDNVKIERVGISGDYVQVSLDLHKWIKERTNSPAAAVLILEAVKDQINSELTVGALQTILTQMQNLAKATIETPDPKTFN